LVGVKGKTKKGTPRKKVKQNKDPLANSTKKRVTLQGGPSP